MKKVLIMLALITLLAFSACQTQQTVSEDSALPVYRVQANTDTQEQANAQEDSNKIKEFTITIEKNTVEPATINVNVGDHVRLDIVNNIGKEKYDDEKGNEQVRYHDFAITIPGIEAEEISYDYGSIFYDFVAKEPGVYNFVCTEGCMPGAVELDNLIIVK